MTKFIDPSLVTVSGPHHVTGIKGGAVSETTQKPLWRLELERESALRRFKRAEEAYREAEKELHRINAEIDARRGKHEPVHGGL